MKKVNEGLMIAAWNGDESGLKALLLRPGCDHMSRDGVGMTALMCAAEGGHASCVELLIPISDALPKDKHGRTALILAAEGGNTSCTELLIPVSDALALDNDGWTARELARSKEHTSLAAFIDAYALALSEVSVLDSLVAPRATGKQASLRV